MAQSIIDVLGMVRGGYALHDAGKKLAELLAAVESTQQAGELTFTIKVKPDKNDRRLFTIKPVVKAKIPEMGYSEGHLYYDVAKKTVSRDDPAQLELLAERRAEGVASMQRSEAALEQIGRGS